jgi:protocatechuate 3,4-dioxygenase beta subunit
MKPTFILLAIMLLARPFPSIGQEEAPYPPPPADVSSVVYMVTDNEPGERLVINGVVYGSDSRTPLDGFVLYLYQTDASGVYNSTDRSWKRPRIRGWVKTDKEGRYEIRTIKPGNYPGSRNPAHIHVIAKLPGRDPDWLDDFLFEGDPFLSQKDRRRLETEGTFSPVMKIARGEGGVLHCKRDIKIPFKTNNIEHR